MSTTPSARAGRSGRRQRLDSGVAWAMGLWLVSFPLMLVFLVMITWIAAGAGIELGSGSPGERRLNTLYVLAVLAVLAFSALVGVRAWRRRRQGAGLVIAGLSVATAALFVLLPALLTAGS